MLYAPAERAEKFSVSRLSPSLLCAVHHSQFGAGHARILGYIVYVHVLLILGGGKFLVESVEECMCYLYIIIFIVIMCFANYGASEAYNLCIVCREICQPLDAEMRQLF